MRLIKTITTISIIYINVFVYMKQSEMLATQSRLFDTPWTYQTPLSTGFTRQRYHSLLHADPWPRDQTQVSCIAGECFYLSHWGQCWDQFYLGRTEIYQSCCLWSWNSGGGTDWKTKLPTLEKRWKKFSTLSFIF